MITALLVALGGVTVWFLAAWIVLERRRRAAAPPADDPPRPVYHGLVSLGTCFFDTLGIGNFAPTTSLFKLRGSVRDEWIPGTLNAGYTLPTVLQAFLYVSIVDVAPWTLALMIAASTAGAWLGAGFVSRLSRRGIQIGMGLALLAGALLLVASQLKLAPAGGLATGLGTARLAAGVAGNFALGALMTLGIGLYAPCFMLVSLLGMDPRSAFPIMMGSCAFLMPVCGIRFVRDGKYSPHASWILALCGIPSVLVAALLVKELPLYWVRWLVVAVVALTAGLMLRSAWRRPAAPVGA